MKETKKQVDPMEMKRKNMKEKKNNNIMKTKIGNERKEQTYRMIQ
jgi:hypothetical protein